MELTVYSTDSVKCLQFSSLNSISPFHYIYWDSIKSARIQFRLVKGSYFPITKINSNAFNGFHSQLIRYKGETIGNKSNQHKRIYCLFWIEFFAPVCGDPYTLVLVCVRIEFSFYGAFFEHWEIVVCACLHRELKCLRNTLRFQLIYNWN